MMLFIILSSLMYFLIDVSSVVYLMLPNFLVWYHDVHHDGNLCSRGMG